MRVDKPQANPRPGLPRSAGEAPGLALQQAQRRVWELKRICWKSHRRRAFWVGVSLASAGCRQVLASGGGDSEPLPHPAPLPGHAGPAAPPLHTAMCCRHRVAVSDPRRHVGVFLWVWGATCICLPLRSLRHCGHPPTVCRPGPPVTVLRGEERGGGLCGLGPVPPTHCLCDSHPLSSGPPPRGAVPSPGRAPCGARGPTVCPPAAAVSCVRRDVPGDVWCPPG